MLERIHLLYSAQRLTDSDFDRKVEFWSEELADAGLTTDNLHNAYRKARKMRQGDPVKRNFPMTVDEIIVGHLALEAEGQEAQKLQKLTSVSCWFCLNAKPPDLVCPTHGGV